MTHAKNAAERIVYGPRHYGTGDSVTMCHIPTVNESAVDLITRETQQAIDAATAELRAEVERLTKERDQLDTACKRHKEKLKRWWRYTMLDFVVKSWKTERDDLRAQLTALKDSKEK